MLGDKVVELSGQSSAMRVLPGDDYRYIKVETSIQATGKILGADGMAMATFVSFERVPGQMYSEGQGLVATNDGESAIWNGHGIGHMTEGGGMSIRYAIAYQASPTGKLAALNGALAIGEFESKPDGSFTTTEWLWK